MAINFVNNPKVGDNVKIEVGNSSDLQIYHDGTHSYVESISGATGDLYIKSGSDDLVLQSADDIFIYTQGGEDAIIARGNAAVELYHNNSKKFETTANGVNIVDSELGIGAGHATASPGNAVIFAPYGAGTNIAGGEIQIYSGRSTGNAAGGSIKFYISPTGSSGSAANAHAQVLLLDSGKNATFAGNVGIGSFPTSRLQIEQSILPRITMIKTGVLSWYVGNPTQGSSGNFTIGTDSGSNLDILTLDTSANATFAGDIKFVGDGLISSNTADGSDNAQIVISGGGASGDTRGASVHISGNESGNAGLLQLRAGSGSVSEIRSYTDGSERIRVNSSGNVGIGTTSPTTARLVVNGAQNTYTLRLNADETTGQSYGLRVRAGTNSSDKALFVENATAASELFSIKGDGNATFGGAVTITNSSAPVLRLTNTTGSQSWIQYVGSNDDFIIRDETDSRTTLLIDGSGNIGIGTTSPTKKLTISDNSAQVLLIDTSSSNTLEVEVGDEIASFKLDKDGAAENSKFVWSIDDASRMELTIAEGDQSQLKLNNYGSGNITGTAAYTLQVDSNGNVIEGSTSGGGTVTGTGTATRVAFWSGTSALSSDANLYWDNTNNRLGIGTTSPDAKLDIQGDGADFFLQSADHKIARIQPRGTGANLDKGLFSLFNGSTESVRIDTDGNSWLNGGNVGIGLTSPSHKIDVSDSSTTWAGKILNTNTRGYGLLVRSDSTTASDLIFGAYGNGGAGAGYKMAIQAAGNVGIGTISPVTALDVRGEVSVAYNATYGLRFYNNARNNWSSIGNNVASGTAANLVFKDSTGEVMRITGGEVGIGTTAPANKLSVNLTSSVALANQPAVPLFVGNNSNSVDGRVFIDVKHDKINTASAIGAGLRMQAGAVTTGTASYNSSLIFLQSAGPGSNTIHSAPKAIKFYVDNHDTAAGSGANYNVFGDLAMTIAENTNVTFAGNVSASEFDLPSGGTLDWANGDARIIEGLVNNYSLSFQTYDGSGISTALRLDGNNNATFAGDVGLADNKKLKFGAGPDLEIYHNSTTNVNHISSLLSRQLSINADATTFSGDVNVQDNLYLQDGSTTRAKIQLNASDTDDLDIKAVSLGSNMKFFTVDTERMRIDSSGKVGIGTTNAQAKLDVQGQIRSTSNIVSNSGYDAFYIGSSRTINDYGGLYKNYFTMKLQTPAGAHAYGDLRFQLANSPSTTAEIDVMTLSYTGNVGIGTTSPAVELDVAGTVRSTSSSTKYAQLESNSSGGVVKGVGGNGFLVRSYGDSYFNGGDFGIGTTSPQELLHVAASNTTATLEIQGGLNSITAVDQVHSEINFGANDASVTGGIAGSIKSITEISNGAHAGLAFYTGQQSRDPYLQRAMQIRNTGAISFGSGNSSYGSSGQILTSNGINNSPSWVSAGGTSGVAPMVKFNRSGINSSTYTMIATVNGNNLASIIQMTMTGTSGNVVFACTFDITVNHSQDIHVKSMNGDYTEVTLRITSNNNEDYSIEAKHNGSTTTTAEVCIFPLADEIITPTTTDPGYTGAEYEHTAVEGWRFGGEDGNVESSNVIVDGNVGIGTTLLQTEYLNSLQAQVGA